MTELGRPRIRPSGEECSEEPKESFGQRESLCESLLLFNKRRDIFLSSEQMSISC